MARKVPTPDPCSRGRNEAAGGRDPVIAGLAGPRWARRTWSVATPHARLFGRLQPGLLDLANGGVVRCRPGARLEAGWRQVLGASFRHRALVLRLLQPHVLALNAIQRGEPLLGRACIGHVHRSARREAAGRTCVADAAVIMAAVDDVLRVRDAGCRSTERHGAGPAHGAPLVQVAPWVSPWVPGHHAASQAGPVAAGTLGAGGFLCKVIMARGISPANSKSSASIDRAMHAWIACRSSCVGLRST